MEKDNFDILTFGYGYRLIDVVWTKVGARTGYQMSHVPHPSLFPSDADQHARKINPHKLFYLFDSPVKILDKADCAYLAELEADEGPTIHNIIFGDARLSTLPYAEALDYIYAAAKRLREIFGEVKPDVVLSGFEGFHSTLAMLVCRKMDIPWFGLVYTPIPKGFTGFSPTNNSSKTRSFGKNNPLLIREWAERTLTEFGNRSMSVHVPETESSAWNVLKFLPLRAKNALTKSKSILSGNFDRYTHRTLTESAKDYLRRRWNLYSNRGLKFLKVPPDTPYVFFGFHMQPEMGIDVWAPYFSNQPYVISCIAKSIPPTHKVLVKLHKIDADHWSNTQLRRIEKMPGVELVSSTANSQDFVTKADIVFSIQGTIALEAALLGRPVITFGETMYEDLPTVTRVGSLIDLPQLVRSKLKEQHPSRAKILQGLEKLLSRFSPGLHNNWDIDPTDFQLSQFCIHLDYLRHAIENPNTGIIREQENNAYCGLSVE